jgi:hypothetical protein
MNRPYAGGQFQASWVKKDWTLDRVDGWLIYFDRIEEGIGKKEVS